MIQNTNGIVTIGYEGRNIDQFIKILVENGVGKLIDVRKNAFSMKSGFSKNSLKSSLEKCGISYLHLSELGIDSNRRKNLTKDGINKLFKRYALELDAKEDNINIITVLAQKERVALMCFEARESDCHRGVIAKRFRDDGLNVIAL